MKKIFLNALLATVTASTVLTTGCATIFGRSNYNVTINSNPSGSNLSIVNKKGVEIYKGTTPATIKLKSSSGYFSKEEYQLKFSLIGHEERIVPLTAKLNGWYFGNLLLGGVIGMLIIDPASGAMYKLPDTAITENLSKTASAQANELKVIDINSLSTAETANLIRIN